MQNRDSKNKGYPLLLLLGGLTGLLASLTLVIDKIKVLENPEFIPSCNINPLISCTSIIEAWQNEIFGFPNALLGMIFFTGIVAIGLFLILKNLINKKFYLLFVSGVTVSIVFVHWFIYQSIFNIGSLCPYCMVVWTVTWPIFLYTLISGIKNNFILKTEHGLGKFLLKNSILILVLWYVLIAGIILLKFKDFFL